MRVAFNCSQVPAVATLEDADNFTAFDVVIERPEHVWISREQLIELAGARADDARWCEQLDAMVDFATSKGWVDGSGRIRAHVTDIES